MRVAWFLLFLQIQCKKKQFLIQTENGDLRNSSEKQSQGIAESKVETIIEGNSKNKSKNLVIVKKAKQKGKDYWSVEEYSDYPHNGYDGYLYYEDDHPFYNSYGNDKQLDNYFDNHIGNQRCGRNSRKGRNHQYKLRLNEALQLDCGHGGCVGAVMFSSCRTRNKFERF